MEDCLDIAVGLIDSENSTDPHFSALRTRLNGMLKSPGTPSAVHREFWRYRYL